MFAATLSMVRITGDSSKKMKACVRFQGNDTGKNPKELGGSPGTTYHLYKAFDVAYK